MKLTSMIAVLAFAFVAQAQEPAAAPAATSPAAPAMSEPAAAHPAHAKKNLKRKSTLKKKNQLTTSFLFRRSNSVKGKPQACLFFIKNRL